jgi:hypothetical protein
VTFASSSGDKSVGFKLAYDSELLSVVGAEPGSESAIAPLATVATQTGTSITNVNMPATSSTASSDQVSQSPSITAVAPLSAATKLNATFTSGGGVKSVVFKLVYDPELVTVTGAELGAGMPNGAQIAFTTAATERAAEAEAYIAVTSDQPIAAGTINLASVSIDPRRSVETLDGLLKLVVEDVNSKLFSEPEAVRISIDGLKLGSSETSDTARDTLPQIDFFASSKVNEDPSPKIRLKIPDQDASPDQGSGESASADDLMADPENVDMPFRIAIADVRTNEMDDSLSSRFEHSRRWTLDWRDNDAATDSLRKVRIPIASLAKGSGASGNPAISLR